MIRLASILKQIREKDGVPGCMHNFIWMVREQNMQCIECGMIITRQEMHSAVRL